jgi:hypothetical protein
MNQMFIRNVSLLVCVLLLAGCTELRQYSSESVEIREPKVTDYLLSCLNDIQDIGPEEFAVNFEMAADSLQHDSNPDKLHFICISLHAKADYKQLKQGIKVLEQYIAEHPDSPDNILGFQILVDRIDKEIITKWSAWKSLLEENDELKIKVQSLRGELEQNQVLIKELRNQIEQLKNIENIIKSRETGQP